MESVAGVKLAKVKDLLRGTRVLSIALPGAQAGDGEKARMVDVLWDLAKYIGEGNQELRVVSFPRGSVVYEDMQLALMTLVKKAGNVRKMHFPTTWQNSGSRVVKAEVHVKGVRLHTVYAPDPRVKVMGEAGR